jgi:hypothetical protein
MKAKVERGSGFRGVVNYALGKGGNAVEIVGGNMSGRDPRSLAAEFGMGRAARSNVKRPVWHVSLALPPGDALSSDKWADVANDFMAGMGLDRHQFIAIRHADTDIDHIHIIGNRIALDGSLYLGKFDAKRAIRLTQELEIRHGLTITKGLDDEPAEVKTPTRNEMEMSLRTEIAPPRQRLQVIVDAALAVGGSVFDFMDRIEAAGAVARPNVAKTGKMNGFAFELDGIAFKGSDLGKGYTWNGLQQKGITYEQDRDGEALRARAGGTGRAEGEIDSGVPAAAHQEDRGDGRRHVELDGRSAPDVPQVASSDRVVDAEVGRDDPEGDDRDRGPADEGLGNGHARRHAADSDSGDGIGRDETAVSRGGPSGAPGQSKAVGADRHVGSVRPDDWNPAVDRVHDLAAGAYPATLAGGADDQAITPALAAKRLSWDRQHSALQSPAYRLFMMSRRDNLASFNIGKDRGPNGTELTYSAGEVRDMIPYLSAQNAKGRDIYITPIDKDHHYLVLDDLTEQSLADFLAAGYRPVLVQQSSENNFQAVLKVPRVEDRDEQKAANKVVIDLNRRYGDEKFSGAIHPFRMAGFANKKPGKGNPFTRIITVIGEICARTVAALDEIRVSLARERLDASLARPTPKGQNPRQIAQEAPQRPAGDAEAAFDRARKMTHALAVQKGWTLDESRIDFGAAKMLAEQGFGQEDIAQAILARSPDVEGRHRNADGYARRTAENAIMKVRPGGTTDEPEGPQGPQGPQGP